MIPVKCYTCGYILGDKIIEYETEMHLILNSNDSEKIKKKKKEELINKLIPDKTSYCCKSILISAIDIVNIVE